MRSLLLHVMRVVPTIGVPVGSRRAGRQLGVPVGSRRAGRQLGVPVGLGVLIGLVALTSQPGPAAGDPSRRAVYERGHADVTSEPAIEYNAAGELGFLFPCFTAFGRGGSIFLLDFTDKTILKYNRDGELERQFSRDGQGPGELAIPVAIEPGPDGTLVVYDVGNHRFTVFDENGGLVRTLSFADMSIYTMEQMRVDPEGRIYVEVREGDFTGTEGESLAHIIRYGPELDNKTVVTSRRITDNDYVIDVTGDNTKMMNIPRPYHDDLSWELLPSGQLITLWSGNYEITMYSSALEVVKQFRHTGGKRLDVTEADRDDYFRSFRNSTDIDLIRKRATFPATKPYFFGLLTDEDGFIIVMTYEERGDDILCDVFDPAGDFVSRFALPSRLSKCQFHGGAAYVWRAFADEAGGRVFALDRCHLH